MPGTINLPDAMDTLAALFFTIAGILLTIGLTFYYVDPNRRQ